MPGPGGLATDGGTKQRDLQEDHHDDQRGIQGPCVRHVRGLFEVPFHARQGHSLGMEKEKVSDRMDHLQSLFWCSAR